MDKITLIGFNHYYNQRGKDLFELLTLPTGIDKEVLVDNILLRGGEFEVLYADPDFNYKAIGVWAKKWYRTIDKWIKALEIEYSPLENYDRFEDITDTGTNGSTVHNEVEHGHKLEIEHQINNKTEDTTTATLSGGYTSENRRSSYNASDYQGHDKNIVTYDNQRTSNGGYTQNSGLDIDTSVNSGKDESTTTVTDSTRQVRTARLHGNIGVTTSQQMLQSELDIARFSLYDNITDLFLREFVIPVY